MTSIRRTFTIAAVAALVPLATALAAGRSQTDLRKQDAVREAISRQGQPAPGPVLLDAASRALALTDFAVTSVAGRPVLTIRTSGAALCDWRFTDDGRAFVIDLFNTVDLGAGQTRGSKDDKIVRQVRSSFCALSPQFVSRITATLGVPCVPSVRADGNTVSVTFVPCGRAFSDPAPVGEAIEQADTELARQLRLTTVEKAWFEEANLRALAAVCSADSDVLGTVQKAEQELQRAKLELLSSQLGVAQEASLAAQPVHPTEAVLRQTILQQTTTLEKAKETLRSITETWNADEESLRTEIEQYVVTVTARVQSEQAALEDLRSNLAAKKTAEADQSLKAIRERIKRAQEADADYFAGIHSRQTGLEHAFAAQLGVSGQPLLVAKASQPAETGSPIESLESELTRLRGVPVAAGAPGVETLSNDTLQAVPSAPLRYEVGVRQVLASITEPAPVAAAPATPTPDTASPLPAPAEPPKAPVAPSAEKSEGALPVVTPAEDAKDAPKLETLSPLPEPDAKVKEGVRDAGKAPKASAISTAPPTRDAKPASSKATGKGTDAAPKKTDMPVGDMLNQRVNLDFRNVELSQVVALLARKAQINVIGPDMDIGGLISADIQNIPLRQAIETVLRMKGWGLIEEEGIYRIVRYEEALAAKRSVRLVTLQNGKAEDVKTTLDAMMVGGGKDTAISIAANPATNVIILSGQEKQVAEFEKVVRELDIAKPVLPTVTEAITLSYAKPDEVKKIAQSMSSADTGKVEVDLTGRNVVVTDTPAAVQAIRKLIQRVDAPMKQVAIAAMIVDAVLDDSSETGSQWLINAVRKINKRGKVVGDLTNLTLNTTVGNVNTDLLNAGILHFGVLADQIDFEGAIAAEVGNSNARILANPVVVTVENKKANVSITREYPYQEITQSTQGPPVSSTEFKKVGVQLDVTPRVTASNDIISELTVSESFVRGLSSTGVPIEDKREAATTLRTSNGKTIFIAGLRNNSDNTNVTKVPVLGDIPILNVLFRDTRLENTTTELLVFITCNVMEETLPDLTPEQQEKYNMLGAVPKVPDVSGDAMRSVIKPNELRDPIWRSSASKKRISK